MTLPAAKITDTGIEHLLCVQAGRFGKLNKKVSFPATLDLSPYMAHGKTAPLYHLYALVRQKWRMENVCMENVDTRNQWVLNYILNELKLLAAKKEQKNKNKNPKEEERREKRRERKGK